MDFNKIYFPGTLVCSHCGYEVELIDEYWVHVNQFIMNENKICNGSPWEVISMEEFIIQEVENTLDGV